eukprot:5644979-Pyramimonas_sp.AAC.1
MVKYLSNLRKTDPKVPHLLFWPGRPTGSRQENRQLAYRREPRRALVRTALVGKIWEKDFYV